MIYLDKHNPAVLSPAFPVPPRVALRAELTIGGVTLLTHWWGCSGGHSVISVLYHAVRGAPPGQLRWGFDPVWECFYIESSELFSFFVQGDAALDLASHGLPQGAAVNLGGVWRVEGFGPLPTPKFSLDMPLVGGLTGKAAASPGASIPQISPAKGRIGWVDKPPALPSGAVGWDILAGGAWRGRFAEDGAITRWVSPGREVTTWEIVEIGREVGVLYG